MNCCDDYGECQHGPGCPAGVATVPPAYLQAPRSCHTLGVCQHPERECTGACEQIPRVPFWHDPEPSFTSPAAQPLGWRDQVALVAMFGISAGVIIGCGRWVWANFGEQIMMFFWSAVTLAF